MIVSLLIILYFVTTIKTSYQLFSFFRISTAVFSAREEGQVVNALLHNENMIISHFNFQACFRT